MLFLLLFAEKRNVPRLKEWALGIAMVVGLIATAIVAN